MRAFRHVVLPIVGAAVLIGVSEFVRNRYLLIDRWTSHYAAYGLEFPMAPINGMVWEIWSLCFAFAFFVISRHFEFLHTVALNWFVGFFLMWLVIGNINVLPYGILPTAIPLSIVETLLAAFVVTRVSPPATAGLAR